MKATTIVRQRSLILKALCLRRPVALLAPDIGACLGITHHVGQGVSHLHAADGGGGGCLLLGAPVLRLLYCDGSEYQAGSCSHLNRPPLPP